MNQSSWWPSAVTRIISQAFRKRSGGEAYARISKLIEEEKEYCDKGNYKHMAQILTSIALYEVMQRHGKSEEEAYRIVSEEMWEFLDPSGMQKLARKSFFLRG